MTVNYQEYLLSAKFDRRGRGTAGESMTAAARDALVSHWNEIEETEQR